MARNPNRLQMHTQYQVILKPDPGNPQELYLQSLAALGIDASAHDVRFVEDNWESPALGAWGLGWEVWLDGLEITQFTYFQQSGGHSLDPISVEITYGLERIIMALQGVTHFKDIRYAPGLSYGDVLGRNEYEMSVYNLEKADVDRMRLFFDEYEAEATSMLNQGLAVPAYSYILKMSHTFNILDSRGYVGVTERAHFFARMRDKARAVADAWVGKDEDANETAVVKQPASASTKKDNRLEHGCGRGTTDVPSGTGHRRTASERSRRSDRAVRACRSESACRIADRTW